MEDEQLEEVEEQEALMALFPVGEEIEKQMEGTQVVLQEWQGIL